MSTGTESTENAPYWQSMMRTTSAEPPFKGWYGLRQLLEIKDGKGTTPAMMVRGRGRHRGQEEWFGIVSGAGNLRPLDATLTFIRRDPRGEDVEVKVSSVLLSEGPERRWNEAEGEEEDDDEKDGEDDEGDDYDDHDEAGDYGNDGDEKPAVAKPCITLAAMPTGFLHITCKDARGRELPVPSMDRSLSAHVDHFRRQWAAAVASFRDSGRPLPTRTIDPSGAGVFATVRDRLAWEFEGFMVATAFVLAVRERGVRGVDVVVNFFECFPPWRLVPYFRTFRFRFGSLGSFWTDKFLDMLEKGFPASERRE